MRTTFNALLLLLLLILPWTKTLAAAGLNPRWMISGGGAILPDRNIRDGASSTYRARLKNQFQIGILAAVDLHTPVSLEMGFRNAWNDLDLQAAPVSQAAGGQSTSFTIQQLFCNIALATPYSNGGLRLFATAGTGLRNIHPDNGSGSDIGWSFNYGGGIEARPSRRYSIRVEIRDFLGNFPAFLQSQSSGGLFHDVQTSIGILVHMGK